MNTYHQPCLQCAVVERCAIMQKSLMDCCKYAKAPCTVLTVKDFKFDHCSIRALRPDDESGEYQHLTQQKVNWNDV